MNNIKEISASATFAVRHPVLRPGKPLESCRFEGDDLKTTKHFGVFERQNLVGIVTVLQNKSDLFSEENQFQIRGMAVLESHQKKGFGEKLLLFSEKYIQGEHGTIIWFNAREHASGFYEKAGYKKIGNLFEIPDVGSHYIMYKNL